MGMMANRPLKVVGLLVRQRSPRIEECIYFHAYIRKNKGSVLHEPKVQEPTYHRG